MRKSNTKECEGVSVHRMKAYGEVKEYIYFFLIKLLEAGIAQIGIVPRYVPGGPAIEPL